MKEISAQKITDTVARLCQQANCFLPDDVWRALEAAYQTEKSESGREIFRQILENARTAGKREIALCQDTGIAEVFVDLGQDVHISGNLDSAVNDGVAQGYREGYLRKSVVADPLDRVNTGNNTPAQLHIHVVPGNALRITLLPKGAGTENASVLQMLPPAAGWEGVRAFIIDAVTRKGISACPPLVVGIGIGGTFSSVAGLAKKALLRPIGVFASEPLYADRERDLLRDINASGLGPMGLGGSITALDVHIEHAPCHIASLPVAVNMQCHSCRRTAAVL